MLQILVVLELSQEEIDIVSILIMDVDDGRLNLEMKFGCQ